MARGPKGQIPDPDRVGEVGVAAVPATSRHPGVGGATLRPQVVAAVRPLLSVPRQVTPQVPSGAGRQASMQVVPAVHVGQDGTVVHLGEDALAPGPLPRAGAEAYGRQGPVGRLELEAEVPQVGRQADDPPGEAGVRERQDLLPTVVAEAGLEVRQGPRP